MAALEIKDGIHWVGAVDWALRDFHGYALARKGTTYNAFLVLDEQVTLVDTVSGRACAEFLDNVGQLLDPQDIRYLVVNHVEPDHSGCLVETVELIQPEKIFCSAMGKEFMISHYHREDWPYEVVRTGDLLKLGKKNVQFIELKMLHWPDNMGCFFQEDRLLLSSDAFGHNWATSERFDDQVDFGELKWHLAHYFANILLPYSTNVLSALEKIEELGWEIDMIAPDHGLVFRSHVREALELYRTFATQQAGLKAVIVYDTMWGSTEKMARVIADGLSREGISVKVFCLKTSHHSDVMAEVLDAQAVLVGSPTHNRGVLPYMAAMLRYMEGLRPQGKIAAAFGSYGWQKDSIQCLTKALEGMKMEVVGSLSVRNVPAGDALEQCLALGRDVAAAVMKRQGSGGKE